MITLMHMMHLMHLLMPLPLLMKRRWDPVPTVDSKKESSWDYKTMAMTPLVGLMAELTVTMPCRQLLMPDG